MKRRKKQNQGKPNAKHMENYHEVIIEAFMVHRRCMINASQNNWISKIIGYLFCVKKRRKRKKMKFIEEIEKLQQKNNGIYEFEQIYRVTT